MGLNGALGEVDAVRALGEVVIGLVEADVAVVANAEQLQIRVTGGGDNLVVLRAGSGGVGVGAIGHMRVVQVDVDVIEEVLAHEVVIALGIVVRKAAILVQVVGADLGKVDVALLVPSSELLVGTIGVEPVARPSTQSGLRITWAEMILAALRLISS